MVPDPEDMVLGPPRMSFSSAGRKGAENDKTREGDPQNRLNNFRPRTGDGDGDRFREGRNANPLRRRDASDHDTEGWSTVKPRKSFGAEGAERFQGRMGMAGARDDKRQSKETDRSSRGFDSFNRERDVDEEGRQRNGTRHSKEPSESRTGEKRERMDRAKSWRDKAAVDAEDHGHGRYGGNSNNNNSRQWGRDGRAEREPEWMDEPAEHKMPEKKTLEDFKKWKEEMRQAQEGKSGKPAAVPMPEATDPARPSLRSPPVDAGPDKFFAAFGATPNIPTPSDEVASKPASKSSRFTSFFATQAAPQPEPAPAPAPPPAQGPPGLNGLLGALQAAPSGGANATPDEKQAFANIIAKLKVQSMSATPPAATPFASPPPDPTGGHQKTATAPSPFQQMHGQEGPMGRPPQELHAPRPQQQAARPDQLMQDLLGHHQRVSSQSSGRHEGNKPDPQRNNSNTEFLMNLMRAPDAQRSESAMMRAAQQAQKQVPMAQQQQEHEGEDGRNAQRMRGPPPGFGMDDRFRSEGDFRQGQPQQPPHILQRPQGLPGLDQLPPGFMGGHMPPPQQQGQQPPRGGPMPPPGLQGGRGMPPGMFPPGMPPPGPHMHPDMGNMPAPPRNMGMPPPGFFNGAPPMPGGPPGFMAPMGGFNGPPGPESPFSAGPHSAGPFERGMPQGRGGNFGRG